MPRRLGSARAVKTCSAIASMSGGGIEVFDQLAELVGPAVDVSTEGLLVLALGQLGEAGLDNGEPSAAADRFERELDVGAAWVLVGQAVDVPREAEDGRLLHPLDPHVGPVAAGPGHLGGAARTEVDRRLVAEPGAEAFGGGERGPDLGRRVSDLDGPLDSIGECHDNLRVSSNYSVATYVIATVRLRQEPVLTKRCWGRAIGSNPTRISIAPIGIRSRLTAIPPKPTPTSTGLQTGSRRAITSWMSRTSVPTWNSAGPIACSTSGSDGKLANRSPVITHRKAAAPRTAATSAASATYRWAPPAARTVRATPAASTAKSTIAPKKQTWPTSH